MALPSQSPSDPSTEFLLAEHARLVQLFLNTREMAERRVTLYLTLFTAALAVLGALFQLNLAADTQLETGLVAAAGLLLFGAITFLRLLERSMRGTEYLRALNRLNRYFVVHDPEIQNYLFWPPFDDRPQYNRGSAGVDTREVVSFLNSLCGAGLVIFGLSLLGLMLTVALIAGAITAIIVWIGHLRWASQTLDREQVRQQHHVRYPSPPNASHGQPGGEEEV